jgi:hypothetical protein
VKKCVCVYDTLGYVLRSRWLAFFLLSVGEGWGWRREGKERSEWIGYDRVVGDAILCSLVKTLKYSENKSSPNVHTILLILLSTLAISSYRRGGRIGG